ncbi:related to O-methyltransferase GliM [Ramularia collo-cygni]|uniref:Related to O-methyltransferase GliM n=1 Tax=Ramularia collo-cygni TaxID=112498 RepID=A0A2D3V082_9PEZI|nr:related to O-methyltransferase GliM [Ramularia collo-cygni]CZT21188.1 related to O-methyltransferase GliM [Ramularia collo-cygni]
MASNDGNSPEYTSLLETLTDSLHDLQKIHARLTLSHVKRQLEASLHDTEALPHKEVFAISSKIVDVLYATDRLLQPGNLVLADHFLGYADSQCLLATVRQKVPDILSSGPMKVHDLALAADAREDRFRQIMRVVHCKGIFSYDRASDEYSNNHRSELLRSDHWTGWSNWVELYTSQFYEMAKGIPDSIKKDATRGAAQYAFDTELDMFTYFEKQGWLPQLHKTLGAGALAQSPGILTDYPWAEVGNETVIDIGGGGGALIASLLRGNPSMKGGVYDLPSVIDHIRPFFAPNGEYGDIGSRVDPSCLQAGDFFKEIPPNNVYVMKWVLHDWLDEDAIKILKNIRRAIQKGPESRLVVLESILSDTSSGRLSRYGDINMMITAKGRERTEAEWYELAELTGFKIVGIHPLRNAWVAAIDMRPV